MNEIKLKPCPFCGGKAHIQKLIAQQPYFVECDNEFCIAGNSNASFKTEEEAAKAWNRRVCE